MDEALVAKKIFLSKNSHTLADLLHISAEGSTLLLPSPQTDSTLRITQHHGWNFSSNLVVGKKKKIRKTCEGGE